MANRLHILGASGHGRVCADAALASGEWSEVVFYDDFYPELDTCGPWQVLGNGEALLNAVAGGGSAFIAIGGAQARLHWLALVSESGAHVPSLVHPSASVSEYSSVGHGSLIAAGSVVGVGSRLDIGCIINTGATVDHDCLLGDGVHVCPGAHLAGGVTVGPSTWIGIGSVVVQGVSIGRGATIGAGAAVLSDVADSLTVVGVPARPIRA